MSMGAVESDPPIDRQIAELDRLVPREGAKLQFRFRDIDPKRDEEFFGGVHKASKVVTLVGTPSGFMRYGIEICRAVTQADGDADASLETDYLRESSDETMIDRLRVDSSRGKASDRPRFRLEDKVVLSIFGLFMVVVILGFFKGMLVP